MSDGGMTDLQFKNSLRIELCTFENILKYIETEKYDEAKHIIEMNIARITESLKD